MISRPIKWLLLIPIALAAIIAAAWLWLWHTQSGAQWAWNQAADQLANSERPGNLNGHVEGTLGSGLVISQFRYRDKDATVSVRSIMAELEVGLMPVTIDLSRLRVQGIGVELSESGAEKDSGSLNDIGDLDIPYPLTIRNLLIEDGSLIRGDFEQEIERIEGKLFWYDRLEVELLQFETPELAGSFRFDSELRKPFKLQAETRISRFTANENLREDFPWLPGQMDTSALVSGSLQQLDIAARIAWPDWLPQGSLKATVLPMDDWSWTVDLSLPWLELPGRWVEESVEALDPALADNVLFENLEVDARGRGDEFTIAGETRVGSSWIQSDKITFEAASSGSGLDRWHVLGSAQVSAPDWPAGRVDFEVSGEADQLLASLQAPDLFGGSVTVSGQSLPGDDSPWSATIQVRDLSVPPVLEAIDPYLDSELASQLSDITGLLNAQTLTTAIDASGTRVPFTARADIKSFSTGPEDRPLTASGQIELTEDSFSATRLAVRSGSSTLLLAGHPGRQGGLGIDVNISDLDDLVPGFAGSLNGRMIYSQPPGEDFSSASLRTEMSGQGIQLGDWRIGHIEFLPLDPRSAGRQHEVFQGIAPDAPLSAMIEAGNVEGPAGEFSIASAHIIGRINDFALALTARTRNTDLAAELSTGTTGEGFGTWAGMLHDLSIAPPQGQPWALSAPAAFSYENGLRLEAACLNASESASICLDMEQGTGGSERGQVRLSNLSPDLFSAMTDWPLGFSQELTGELSWTRKANRVQSAIGELTLSPGVLVNTAESRELLRSGEGQLSFIIENNSLVRGRLDLPLDSGTVEADLAMNDVMEGMDSVINGRVRIDLERLDGLSDMVANLARLSGQLDIDLDIEGTPGNPRISGRTALSGGEVYVPATGLRVSKLDINGQLDNNNQVQMNGQFIAGDGPGKVTASLDLTDPVRPRLEAHLTGKGMTLVDVPDLQLLADTDIELNWADSDLRVLGTIHVPSARFAPSYLPTDTASESPDVVLISNGEPVFVAEQEQTPLNLFGDLAVSMGDGVIVDLDLAKASVTGAAMFSWRGDSMPVANGEFNVRGEIQAYGQNLEITRAAVRFPNVRADSPHLDIRAEREIYGNSMVTRAGVLVNGTLKRPQTEPYTVPPTNTDRARALLITGSDFDYEQGVGAVNVGTYIAPKLFLSYGVGLFEEGNIITARYELKRNFGVKATSGQDETGIDFTYTIEK